VAPDIAALDKPLGLRCPHLGEDNLCAVYDRRPAVCRSYSADALCREIEAPTLDERVQKYLAHFGLEAEAAAVKASGCRSMKRPSPSPSPSGEGRVIHQPEPLATPLPARGGVGGGAT
jgi:hypothetical protein